MALARPIVLAHGENTLFKGNAMQIITKFGLIVVATLAAVPVLAQTANGPDSRCLLVSNVYASHASDPKAKQIAQAAQLFYGGRVSTLGTARVQADLAAQRKQISTANSGATMTACARAMERSLNALQAASAPPQKGKP